jgi:hypothetical protein
VVDRPGGMHQKMASILMLIFKNVRKVGGDI